MIKLWVSISLMLGVLSTSLGAIEDCVFDDLGVLYRVGCKVEHMTITVTELSYLYSGKLKRFSNGHKATIFVKDYSDYDQKSLAMLVLGVSVSRFIENVNRNENIHKVKRNSMLMELSNTPYSIGVLSGTEVLIRGNYGIRTLKVVR